MESLERHKEFIELRSQGVSYAKIAEKMGLSKTILVEWGKAHSSTISGLKILEMESFVEGLAIGKRHRIESLARVLNGLLKAASNAEALDTQTAISRIPPILAAIRAEDLDVEKALGLLAARESTPVDGQSDIESRTAGEAGETTGNQSVTTEPSANPEGLLLDEVL